LLSIQQHISLRIGILFVVAVLLGMTVSFFNLREIQLREYENTLKSHLNLIEIQLPFSFHPETLKLFAKQIKKSINKRVTIINEEGVVLAETDYEDINMMDNHRYRPEIIQASKEDYGVNLRYSDSIHEDFLYVAKHISYEGESLYLRLGMSTQEIRSNFVKLWIKIGYILLAILLVSLATAALIQRNMQKELQKLKNGLQAIANKEYKTHIKAGFAKEFVQIADTIHQLAAKLAKRDKQKRKHTAKLRLLNKQRSDIIAAVGHEFKNPIASIMGYAQTLLDDPQIDGQIKERFLGKIISNGNKINGMINRLSLATKLENGDLSPNKTQFDLGKLASDITTTFIQRYKDRKFILHTDTSIVNADATMIEMVLNNLLDNAIKYSENTIYIEVTNNKCSIRDEGEGIPVDEIPKITKKFYRSNRYSWDNSIGLGLSLVSYILKLHESELQIQSVLGEGSTFSFRL
jgi:signal transduction histidine kinase